MNDDGRTSKDTRHEKRGYKLHQPSFQTRSVLILKGFSVCVFENFGFGLGYKTKQFISIVIT